MLLVVGALLEGSPQVGAPTADPTGTPTATPPGLPAASSAERRMFEMLNAERVRQGLTPVAWSYELAMAAGLHSAEMAANGYLDHDGLDGSSPQQRAARQGYIVPPGTGWMVIEAISALPLESAFNWLLADGVHRRVLLRPTWREGGIGYASGGRYGHYWTLDFGCRPNVLPAFANASADGQSLALTFTNENCAPYGGGPDQMGRASELMLSAHRDFRDGVWEPFVDAKQIARPAGRDLNVRLRDASGRLSAPSQIVLSSPADGGSVATPTATATATATREPTPTSTPTPSPTATPTATPVPADDELPDRLGSS